MTEYITKQCAYVGADGQRCRRLTTLTHPYCYHHTRIVHGVEVRESTIPGAGKGLFAVRRLPKDTFLFYYDGDRLSVQEYTERYAELGVGPYAIELNATTVIDARRTDAGVARFICSYHGSGRKPNVQYYTTGTCVEVWTIRTIEPGEELLADYGEEMAKALGLVR
ncbi:MAG: SET domain-containing protein-lysine N-methyltransferase [Bacteroidota bacterium]|nr:SET domain-containing protein-lysine N-methyltransferase [Candidatus Kapabacteria bacterium]MCS7302120.1 SET domain-containing protein-lysine N-methyltransferase [Candidatus Kapabacteria bacterium]MCX7936488.1 SET domain-containing protein-lysine N-methyltransferase [Chlorobiota bacterium]MDW8074649.1 SET domain-containing protein-lysine N-methyltransferase [Bacteroidota bacterium]MDW8270875.1 SET domain-containing protein-lysine N-methyltransferase [Bacteroidota bacterium]